MDVDQGPGIIDLRTLAGVEPVHGQWSYADTHIQEMEHRDAVETARRRVACPGATWLTSSKHPRLRDESRPMRAIRNAPQPILFDA